MLKRREPAGTRDEKNIFPTLNIRPSTAWSWSGLIALALIALLAIDGTQYHQLALGVLLAAVTLLILLSSVEFVWQAFEALLGSGRSDASDRTEERE
jgi:hypothetical protein